MKNPLATHRQLPLVLIGAVATLLAAQPAQAAPTWLNAAVSGNWADANWTIAPTSGTSLVFAATSQATLNNNLTTGADWVIPLISFSGAAPAYTISGNAFTLGTSTAASIISNGSSLIQTINDNITLGNAVQTITVGSAGGAGVTFGGNITTGAATGITLLGNGMLTFKGTASLASLSASTGAAATNAVKVDGGNLTLAAWTAGHNITVTNGGSFTLNSSYTTDDHYLTQDSGTVTLNAGSNLINRLFFTTTGGTSVFLTSGNSNTAFNLDASGSATVSANNLRTMTGSTAATGSGTLSVGGNAKVTLTILDLDAWGSAASSTVNLNGGTLTVSGLRRGAAGTGIETVNFNGGTLQVSGAVTTGSYANVNFNILAGGAVIDTQSYLYTLTQPLVSGTAGDGGLKKLGSGTLLLNGVNTYTGATTIASGALKLAAAASIANSSSIIVGNAGSTGAVLDLTAKTSYDILSGQTVSGTGTLNIGSGKTITVDSGGHWAPGNSIGTNTVTGNLTLALGSISDFQLGSSSGLGTRVSPFNSDKTVVSGALTLSGTLNLIDNAGADNNGSVGAGSYQIFTQTGLASGTFSNIVNATGYHAKVDTSTSGSVFVDNYRLAVANTINPTVTLTNIRVGGTFGTSALSIQNTAYAGTYTEGLNANGTTSGAATVSGTIGNLAGQATSTALSVGLGNADTGTAGTRSGTVSIALASSGVNSGLTDTTLTTQNVAVSGTVFNVASANPFNTPVNLGITHVSGTFGTTSLSIQNTSASGSYTEGLNAAGTATGAASVSGTIGNLAGQSTSTAISVGLGNADTGTAGARSGTVSIALASSGINSGLADMGLTGQNVTVNGQVNYYADAAFTAVSGGNLTSSDATHYTLTLGSYKTNSGVYVATITLDNVLHDATYQDLLSGGFDVSGKGAFILDGVDGTVNSITSGSSVTLTVSFDTQSMTSGTYTGSIQFNPTSANTSGTSSLAQLNLGLEFTVVPEPATWAMIVGGLGMMAFVQRARRRISC